MLVMVIVGLLVGVVGLLGSVSGPDDFSDAGHDLQVAVLLQHHSAVLPEELGVGGEDRLSFLIGHFQVACVMQGHFEVPGLGPDGVAGFEHVETAFVHQGGGQVQISGLADDF